MKFEDDSSLSGYLVKNLQPLTEADPVILAEYVSALLKKDKPINELQKLCAEKLVEFLGQGTQSFITKLFQDLEDGSVVAPPNSLDAIVQVEASPVIKENPAEVKNPALNSEDPGSSSDPDEKEVSDDDDDDRNHKHKRRESRPHSFDKDAQGQSFRRTNKRYKSSENGQPFFRNDPQSSENHKEYNPASLERDLTGRIDRRRPGLVPFPRTAYDFGHRNRVNQGFHVDPSQFDLSTSLGRLPTGRGRGRGSGAWNPHDINFSPIDTLDFASQMPPQGPNHNGLFSGRGLQPFGMIPGMPNGGLDTIHPLGLQGALGPQMNQSLSIGISRQRCRDFEERGFCLRGDMCPMEHGVNRIVVEDVQSLSQFNLPVSIPSAHLLGTAHMGNSPSKLQSNTKTSKNNKHGTDKDGFSSVRAPAASSGAGEADLYDPDQPLWNNDHLSSSNVEDAERIWNGEPSERHGYKFSDGSEGEQPGKNIGSASSSVWGRIGNSGSKLDTTENPDATVAPTTSLRNETKDQEEALSSVQGNPHQRKRLSSEDAGSKTLNSTVNSKVQNELARRNGRTSQKALRTLFVNGIPLKNNKRKILLSHFRKFGQIIDIYIPLNSEKAFVQFSKREEAEAALMAPDAVMGNRFIKLWWANRDSIPDNGLSISDSASGPQGMGASVLPLPVSVDKRKEILSSAIPSSSGAPLGDLPVPTAAVYPLSTNGPKVIPSQKKLDNLELLKEELRLKQELLDKKRNDFRRQLERLEKKSTSEPVAKKPKVGTRADHMETSSSSSPINPVRPAIEKAMEKTHSGESVVSPNSRKISTTTVQSPVSLKQPNRTAIPQGTNRFKLDNRPTTFKILPPLPDDFANVVTMKEHFSTYGDVSAVELEASKTDSESASSEPHGNSVATITFTTRRSAEIAFVNGKGWKGHNLKFLWVVVSSISNSNGGRESSPTDIPKVTQDADVQAETAGSGSLSVTGESTSSVPEVADSIGNGETESSVEVKDVSQPLHLVESCQPRTPLSLSQTLSPIAGAPIVEDGIEVKSVS